MAHRDKAEVKQESHSYHDTGTASVTEEYFDESVPKACESDVTPIDMSLESEPLVKGTGDTVEQLQALLKQLHDTQEELLLYRMRYGNITLPKQGQKNRMLYGARYRVENDLPYRLGRIINQHLKTPRGIAKLPKLLTAEYHRFTQERQVEGPLLALDNYIDIKDAEKVKKHLNYRIGLAVAESIKSPKDLLKLPLMISKQVYLFNKDKK